MMSMPGTFSSVVGRRHSVMARRQGAEHEDASVEAEFREEHEVKANTKQRGLLHRVRRRVRKACDRHLPHVFRAFFRTRILPWCVSTVVFSLLCIPMQDSVWDMSARARWHLFNLIYVVIAISAVRCPVGTCH